MYKKQDYNSLIEAILPTTKVNGALAFVPTIVNEATFPDYIAQAATRNFSKLPILIGNNYTAGLFKFMNEIVGEVAYSELFWDANDQTFKCTAATCATSARHTMFLPGGIGILGTSPMYAFQHIRIVVIMPLGVSRSETLLVMFPGNSEGSDSQSNCFLLAVC
jgi:hypothetical protein